MTPLPCWTCGKQPEQRTEKSASGKTSWHAYFCRCGNRTLYYRHKKGESGWLRATTEWNTLARIKAAL